MPELDFVPVNLHIQQMKVGRGEEEKGESRWVWSPARLTFDPTERVVYTCVTAGCPTAYSHKFKQGGLAKLRATTPLANIGSVTPASASSTILYFSLHSSANPSTITKTQRGQTLLGMPHTHRDVQNFQLCLSEVMLIQTRNGCKNPCFGTMCILTTNIVYPSCHSHLVGQIEVVLGSLQKEVDSIRSAAKGRVLSSVNSSTRTLAENVHKLKSLCNINLMHDSVRDLAGAVEPEFKLSETNVVWSHTIYHSFVATYWFMVTGGSVSESGRACGVSRGCGVFSHSLQHG